MQEELLDCRPNPAASYLFVLGSEARPVQLVDGHQDGHHVLTVHDGDGQHALSLILRQLVHEAAEMRTLKRRRGKVKRLSVLRCTAPPGQQGSAVLSATGGPEQEEEEEEELFNRKQTLNSA